MTESIYKCEECAKEIKISFIRLQDLINASYELKMKNNKLLALVEKLSDENSVYGRKIGLAISYEEKELLKEIGEL